MYFFGFFLVAIDPSIGIFATDEELEDEDVTDSFEYIESPDSQIHSAVSPSCSANENISDECNDFEESNVTVASTEEQNLKYAIVKSIFETIELSTKTGASLATIVDLLCFARRMYCRGKGIDENDHPMKCSWPKDWEEAKKYLKDVGYEDAHEYFICLNATHKQHWDIMQSASEKCRFCGEVGTIKYYYLGLHSKVKQWTEDPDMCSKMTAHWSEKEHWINGNDDGWKIKKEVWDGSRFAELAWFWDPDKSWCLPARCVREGCKNVLSADEVLQATARPNGNRELYCECCCTKFLHQPVFVKGDPRNIAYIGNLKVVYDKHDT